MLNDKEYEFYPAAHMLAIKAIQGYKVNTGAQLKDVPTAELVQPALDIFEKLTQVTKLKRSVQSLNKACSEHIWSSM